MFLTNKALRKVRIMAGIYLCLGLITLAVACFLEHTGLIILSVIECMLALLLSWARWFSEGKGKLINSGTKLVFHELRPAAFVQLYEEKRNCPDNVIAKPDLYVLHLLLIAYDALGDTERALETMDQMYSIAPERMKWSVKALRTSALFDAGRIDEAELLYNEVLHTQKYFATKVVLDAITKCDRAIALGDYTTAEEYCVQKLAEKSTKDTPLSVLYTHFHLAKIYCATEQVNRAKIYLSYCIENGGETGIKAEAANMLNNL